VRFLINRPDKRNAIDHEVRQQLTDAFTTALADSSVRAVVLGGVGGVFSAGGDLPSMVGLSESEARGRMQHIHALCRLVANADIPVVSAIEGIGAGAAIGLALLGDQIIVGKGTQILFPFLRLGLVPDWGQLLTLPRRVGLPHARQILVAGKPVQGGEAFLIGLADKVVADDEVMTTAISQATELAQLPSQAFARMKARLNNLSAFLTDELEREMSDQAVCLLSDDFVEGYDAFKNRRVADFVARPGVRK
jgi:2-(1,2-epoxy-1,2-dihydrophenyl)acetyl-CoA isomerase